jgi:hypothetical protein
MQRRIFRHKITMERPDSLHTRECPIVQATDITHSFRGSTENRAPTYLEPRCRTLLDGNSRLDRWVAVRSLSRRRPFMK